MVKVIKLTENDLTEIDIIAEWFDGWYEWTKPFWTYKRIRKRLITMIKSRGHAVFVAKINDICVGTIGIARYDDTKKNGSQYHPWFVNGFVLEEYRNRGIFKCLMKEAEQYLINKKVNRVFIRTDWQGLYEYLGWEYKGDIVLDTGVKERLYEKKLK